VFYDAPLHRTRQREEDPMKRHVAIWSVAAILLGGVLFAQGSTSASAMSSPPDRARLEQVINAWASMDISKPAAFYAKDPGLVFYDVAPRKYVGWDAYAKGSAELFKTVKSLTFTLNDDAQVHTAGTFAWSTATVDGNMVMNDGSSMKIDARWSSVWEKRGTQWLIIHDHFSMPLPEPPPK
jgi:ketosteroid isomerase-like protein